MTKRQTELFPGLQSSKKYLSDYPLLVAEWHPTKNGNLAPDDYQHKSGKKVWWKCEYGHEWDARIYSRVNGCGCPYCGHQLASPDNNLTVHYPELISEWHPTKNDKSPENYLHGSNKKVWWQCKHGHEWEASIHKRTIGRGCPHCYNINRSELARPKASTTHNLLTENPTLCRQWDYIKNDKPPEYYMVKSGSEVWWKCDKGSDHSWKARIANRTAENDGILIDCPFCKGRIASLDYNLEVNFPELIKDWNFEKNRKLPSDYTPHSNHIVWWICSRGHEWKAKIANRANGRNCPKCNNQSSKSEMRIYTEMLAIFDNVETRYKFDNFEVDIFIHDLSIAIEYDGRYWHKNKSKADNKKQDYVTAKGIQLIRVREEPLEAISSNDIIVSPHKELSKCDLDNLLSGFRTTDSRISEYLSKDTFVNDKTFKTYLDYFPSPFPEFSLATKNPTLASQWHKEKNDPLSPYNFTPNSGQKVWWKCDKGHEWEATIDSRNSSQRKSNCPYCSPTRKTVSSFNCMAVTHPELVEMFHPTLNGSITPDTILAGTGKRLWWRCTMNPTHEFERSGYAMAKPRKGLHCPHCRKEKPK